MSSFTSKISRMNLDFLPFRWVFVKYSRERRTGLVDDNSGVCVFIIFWQYLNDWSDLVDANNGVFIICVRCFNLSGHVHTHTQFM